MVFLKIGLLVEQRLLIDGDRILLPERLVGTDEQEATVEQVSRGRWTLVMYSGAKKLDVKSPRSFVKNATKKILPAVEAWAQCRLQRLGVVVSLKVVYDAWARSSSSIPVVVRAGSCSSSCSFAPEDEGSDDEEDFVQGLEPPDLPPVLATLDEDGEYVFDGPTFATAPEVVVRMLWGYGDAAENEHRLRQHVVRRLLEDLGASDTRDVTIRKLRPWALNINISAVAPPTITADDERDVRRALQEYAGRLTPPAGAHSWARVELVKVVEVLPIKITVYKNGNANRAPCFGDDSEVVVRHLVISLREDHGFQAGYIRAPLATTRTDEAPEETPSLYLVESCGVSQSGEYMVLEGRKLLLAEGMAMRHPSDDNVRQVVIMKSPEGGPNAFDVYFNYGGRGNVRLVATLVKPTTPRPRPPPPPPPSSGGGVSQALELLNSELLYLAHAVAEGPAAKTQRVDAANTRVRDLQQAQKIRVLLAGFTGAGKSTLISSLCHASLGDWKGKPGACSEWSVVPKAPGSKNLRELKELLLGYADERELEQLKRCTRISPARAANSCTSLKTRYEWSAEPQVTLKWRPRAEIVEVFQDAKKTVRDYAATADKSTFECDELSLKHASFLLMKKTKKHDDDCSSSDEEEEDDDLATDAETLLQTPEEAFELPHDVAKLLEPIWGKTTRYTVRGPSSLAEMEKELSETLLLFTTILRDAQFSVWSLVEQVTVGLPSVLLETTTLVDLPGFEGEVFRNDQIESECDNFDVLLHVVPDKNINEDFWSGMLKTKLFQRVLEDIARRPVVLVLPKDKYGMTDDEARTAVKTRKREWATRLYETTVGLSESERKKNRKTFSNNTHTCSVRRIDLDDLTSRLAKLHAMRTCQVQLEVAEQIRSEALELRAQARCADEAFATGRFRPEGAADNTALIKVARDLARMTGQPFSLRADRNFMSEYGDQLEKLDQTIRPFREECTPERLETLAPTKKYKYIKQHSRTLYSDIYHPSPMKTRLFDFLVGPLHDNAPCRLVHHMKLTEGRFVGDGILLKELRWARDVAEQCIARLDAAKEQRDGDDDDDQRLLTGKIVEYCKNRLKTALDKGTKNAKESYDQWRASGLWKDINLKFKNALDRVIPKVQGLPRGQGINRRRVDALKLEEPELVGAFGDELKNSIARFVDRFNTRLQKDIKEAVDAVVIDLRSAAKGITPPGMLRIQRSSSGLSSSSENSGAGTTQGADHLEARLDAITTQLDGHIAKLGPQLDEITKNPPPTPTQTQ